jgi:multicomponent Na+:H+ antiporter subunit G
VSAADWVGFVVALVGAAFFLAGTAGLLRFPDPLSRLHALPKADNLGLGFTALGMAIQAGSAAVAVKLLLIWLLTLLASATSTYLIASRETDDGAPAADA